MPKRRNLNGLPHNLVKSYFGTLRYHKSGYMADWLLNAARVMRVSTVMLDVWNSSISPDKMEILPLLYHLKDVKKVIERKLHENGFEQDFIVSATIRVEIPDKHPDARTLFCYPELIDIEGRKYGGERIIETAYEKSFDPFDKHSFLDNLFVKIQKAFKKI